MATPENLPPTTPQPCNDCPWRRVATAGWLGPYGAARWLEIAHSESPVACHKTIRVENPGDEGDWADPAMRQCRGIAIFRDHVCKSPRHPDIETGPEDHENVFSTHAEFLSHHERREFTDDEATDLLLERMYPRG
jgi:hypothetical protein